MKCQFCNTELEDDALFCHECGAKTGESPAEEPGEEMRKCSGCGAELNPEAKFCSHCGTPAAGQSPVRKSDKSSRFSVDQIRVFTEKVIEKIKEKPKRSAIIAAAAAAVIVLLIIVSSLTGGNSPAPTSSAGGSYPIRRRVQDPAAGPTTTMSSSQLARFTKKYRAHTALQIPAAQSTRSTKQRKRETTRSCTESCTSTISTENRLPAIPTVPEVISAPLPSRSTTIPAKRSAVR